jgi:riboflavin kinase/FMN adenylyltransferase
VKLLRSLEALPAAAQGGAVAIGNFDGVHAGHAQIIDQLRQAAQRVSGPSTVLTFDPHPVRLLRPSEAPPPLTWTDRKAQLLSDLGVDMVVAYPTDEALLKLSAREFFSQIVCGHLQAKALVEGPNFRFGRGREGDVAMLGQLAHEAGISLSVVEPVVVDGQIVSSSRVRGLIAAGQIEQATQLLTQPYRIRGLVVHGAGRGAKLGFPTANIDGIDTLLPPPGVYAGRVLRQNSKYAAAINIGPNPTFGEHALKVEIHLIDWQGSLYGEVLEVDFTARLRDIQRFESAEKLQQQLQSDIANAQKLSPV